jgi:hypothetical protein
VPSSGFPVSPVLPRPGHFLPGFLLHRVRTPVNRKAQALYLCNPGLLLPRMGFSRRANTQPPPRRESFRVVDVEPFPVLEEQQFEPAGRRLGLMLPPEGRSLPPGPDSAVKRLRLGACPACAPHLFGVAAMPSPWNPRTAVDYSRSRLLYYKPWTLSSFGGVHLPVKKTSVAKNCGIFAIPEWNKDMPCDRMNLFHFRPLGASVKETRRSFHLVPLLYPSSPLLSMLGTARRPDSVISADRIV